MTIYVPRRYHVTTDPLDWNIQPIEIFDGWYRVWSGAVKPGDLFLNTRLWTSDGIPDWMPVNAEELNTPDDLKIYGVDRCECVIRRGESVAKGCDRCQCHRASYGYRFCTFCQAIIRDEIRHNNVS